VRPIDLRAFVPINSQPPKTLEYGIQRRLNIPLLIRIIDPKNELATVLFGK
jgi:hypothetical protein